MVGSRTYRAAQDRTRKRRHGTWTKRQGPVEKTRAHGTAKHDTQTQARSRPGGEERAAGTARPSRIALVFPKREPDQLTPENEPIPLQFLRKSQKSDSPHFFGRSRLLHLQHPPEPPQKRHVRRSRKNRSTFWLQIGPFGLPFHFENTLQIPPIPTYLPGNQNDLFF